MINYYNRKGEVIDMMEWGKLLENKGYKIVKQKTLSDGKRVSTIWLGLDHSFDGGKPLIFETMLLSKGDDNGDMERYSTEEEAIKGHKKMVKKYSNK